MKKEKYNFEPCLLISMPQMQDPNFTQTVSLLSELNNKGAIALILNRKLQISLHDVLSPDFRKQLELDPKVGQTLKKSPVYWGGPVDIQQGLILHNCKEFQDDSVIIQDDIFITGSINVLKDLIKKQAYGDTEVFFRFVLGYSGWSPHQLEQEIAGSCWVTSDLETSIFTMDSEKLWSQSVKNLGIELSQLATVTQENYH